MAIPEINAKQLSLLISMVEGLGAFSEAVPDPKLDPASDYEAAMESVRDTEQLLILGLIKELTGDKEVKEKLCTLFAMTGRLFRVFEITEIGTKMFEVNSRSIN